MKARRPIRVLALASYPVEAAATRFRLQQFVAPLAGRGIELEIRPFINSDLFRRLYKQRSFTRNAVGLAKSALLRLRDIFSARGADVILIQREAAMFGPPLMEWLITRVLKRPMMLDLDDATYISYQSPTYGSFAKTLKWFSKTEDLIKWASLVTCGNSKIAEYVQSKGAKARVLPTVVDTDLFCPRPQTASSDTVVLGWVGTHSTFPFLKSILPVLSSLGQNYRFRLKVVGGGGDFSVPRVEVENLPWRLDREIQDFQSIDIGLYPIDPSLYSTKWAQGKSGFKAIQYLAVGVPYVASPVGGSTEIGTEGITHFFASTDEEWYRALEILITDESRRRQMGRSGREHALEHYALEAQAEILAGALEQSFESAQ